MVKVDQEVFDALLIICRGTLAEVGQEQMVKTLEQLRDDNPQDAEMWQGAIDILTGRADYDVERDELLYRLF